MKFSLIILIFVVFSCSYNKDKEFTELKQLFDSRNYREAISEFSKHLVKNPKSDSAYYYRGASYIELKVLDSALADIQKAINLNPKKAKYYFLRGIVRYFNEDYTEAKLDFMTTIEIDSNFSSAYARLGYLENELGNNELSLVHYNRAIALEPKVAFPYSGRAFLKYDLKDFEGAILDFNSAIKFDKRSNEYLVILYGFKAECFEQLGQLDSACIQWRTIIAQANEDNIWFKESQRKIKEQCN